MKYLFILLLCLPIVLFAQNDWALPINAEVGKTYAQCIIFPQDTLIYNQRCRYPIPPMTWEEARFKVQDAYSLKTVVRMPVFDTLILKIPVDKTTRMANMPNEYAIVSVLTYLNPPLSRWIRRTDAQIQFIDTSNCQIWMKKEVPHYGKFIPTLTLKSTAHQLRIDTADTVFIKQIVEKEPTLFREDVIPADYQTVLIKKAPHPFWSDWREVMICGRMEEVTVAEIQVALQRLNYYHGKINNKMDKRTKRAITEYRMAIGLPAHGNGELYKSLGLDY